MMEVVKTWTSGQSLAVMLPKRIAAWLLGDNKPGQHVRIQSAVLKDQRALVITLDVDNNYVDELTLKQHVIDRLLG